MTSLLRVDEEHGSDPHRLTILRPGCPDWLERLAKAYRALRTSTAVDVDQLDLSHLQILSTDLLKQRIVDAAIAQRRGGNFDVLRSDLAEMALLLHVEEAFGCCFGVISIRDRELPGSAGRGIDLVGVEMSTATVTSSTSATPAEDSGVGQGANDGSAPQPALVLVLGEAKTSSQAESPPRVVDRDELCLRSQHLANFADLDKTADKVLNAARAATDPQVMSAMSIASEALRQGRFDIVQVAATSMMVRPASQGTMTDFGTFRTAPEDYAPAWVRFLLLRLDDDDIEGLVDQFLELVTRHDEDDREREEG